MNPASAIACSTTLRRSFARVRVVERREARGRLDDAGDRGRFAQRQVADVLAEEQPRRFRHAVDGKRSALAERDVVQVQLRIWSFVSRRSSATDMNYSETLRLSVLFRVSGRCS